MKAYIRDNWKMYLGMVAFIMLVAIAGTSDAAMGMG